MQRLPSIRARRARRARLVRARTPDEPQARFACSIISISRALSMTPVICDAMATSLRTSAVPYGWSALRSTTSAPIGRARDKSGAAIIARPACLPAAGETRVSASCATVSACWRMGSNPSPDRAHSASFPSGPARKTAHVSDSSSCAMAEAAACSAALGELACSMMWIELLFEVHRLTRCRLHAKPGRH